MATKLDLPPPATPADEHAADWMLKHRDRTIYLLLRDLNSGSYQDMVSAIKKSLDFNDIAYNNVARVMHILCYKTGHHDLLNSIEFVCGELDTVAVGNHILDLIKPHHHFTSRGLFRDWVVSCHGEKLKEIYGTRLTTQVLIQVAGGIWPDVKEENKTQELSTIVGNYILDLIKPNHSFTNLSSFRSWVMQHHELAIKKFYGPQLTTQVLVQVIKDVWPKVKSTSVPTQDFNGLETRALSAPCQKHDDFVDSAIRKKQFFDSLPVPLPKRDDHVDALKSLFEHKVNFSLPVFDPSKIKAATLSPDQTNKEPKPMTALYEVKEFINGIEASILTDETLIQIIRETEVKINDLESIETKSTAIDKQIEDLKAELKNVVEVLDNRNA